ncbi:glutamate racemase [uncultured Shewanella sp.]|uniref:glutamate racemase n=1 Tax=uncultured Shewanella sp. TaxID=173975 RepID=UPI00262F1677|nr:glutamate racemase [uncultured Shewanella sp.]
MAGPILVFDSGIGGLSVLNTIKSVLPEASYCYVFDNARLPYGELDEQDLIAGCVTLICDIAVREKAALVVVACNTASTLVLPILRQKMSIPIVGVVPAIKPAATSSIRKKIGLLATPATVTRAYTRDLIQRFASDCEVHLFGSSELVLLAEEKAIGDRIDKQCLELILTPVKNSGVDTLVLGCTHFPVLKNEIQAILGSDIQLLDSELAIASRVQCLFKNEKAQRDKSNTTAYYTANSISLALKNKLANDGFVNVSRFHIG